MLSIQDRFRGALVIGSADRQFAKDQPVSEENYHKALKGLCDILLKEKVGDLSQFLFKNQTVLLNPAVAIALRFHRTPDQRILKIRNLIRSSAFDHTAHDFWLMHTGVLGELIEGKEPREAIDFAVRYHGGSHTFTDALSPIVNWLEHTLSIGESQQSIPNIGNEINAAGALVGAWKGEGGVTNLHLSPQQGKDHVRNLADRLFNRAYGYAG